MDNSLPTQRYPTYPKRRSFFVMFYDIQFRYIDESEPFFQKVCGETDIPTYVSVAKSKAKKSQRRIVLTIFSKPHIIVINPQSTTEPIKRNYTAGHRVPGALPEQKDIIPTPDETLAVLDCGD